MKINTADKANYSIGALIDRYIQLFVGAFWGHGVRYSLLPFSQEEYVNLQGAGKKTCHKFWKMYPDDYLQLLSLTIKQAIIQLTARVKREMLIISLPILTVPLQRFMIILA